VLTTDQKGVIAELAIARQAADLGIGVWHSYTIERYDLIFDNQRIQVNWAVDFEFAAKLGQHQGAVAQLGERLAGSQKATGSSPVGSIAWT
jgi:hypothetical protein